MQTRLVAGFCSFLLLVAIVPAQTAAPTLRVLFLGNSLTDGNDVPGIVQALAQLHDVALIADVNAPGGFSLGDHWNVGHGDRVRHGSYDLVVLQQGPSTLPESQANLKEWTQIWTQHARTQGTEAALFMVWPFKSQANGFELVSLSYRNAAQFAGIEAFPAGERWQAALAAQPGLSLYSDDLHANAAGSLLAAMTIGRRLFALDPARVPARLTTRAGTIAVAASTLETFRAVVARVPAANFSASTPPATPAGANTPVVTLPAPTGAAGPTGGTRGSGGGSASTLATLALAAIAFCRALRLSRKRAVGTRFSNETGGTVW